MQRRFDRALLIGCPDREWPSGSRSRERGRCARPGAAVRRSAGGEPIVEDAWEPPRGAYDLVARGRHARHRQRPAARAAADPPRHAGRTACSSARCPAATRCRNCARRCAPPTRSAGGAAPHVHPRIEPSALAPLLADAGLRQRGRRRRPGRRSPIRRWTRLVGDLRADGRDQHAARPPAGSSARAALRRRRRSLRRRRRWRAHRRNVRNPALRRLDAAHEGLKRALTVSAARVVNPATVKPAAWTWTRGGWRDRYPDNLAQARRRPARSDCDRIWADCRADRHCDDGRAVSRSAAASAACGASSATRRTPTCRN